jgi:prepilin-type N-terminal cleavage/methylation domain-containing protein
MKNQKSKIKNQKFVRHYRSGFTMAELLIALMITGMLLAAIAFAFSASVKNFNDNREIFLAANKARQALTQIVPRLRTGQYFNTLSPDNECTFQNADGQWITYSYNSGDRKLNMTEGGNTHLLCDNVTAMTFTKNTSGGDVKSVIISITVTEGSTSQTFSTAVVIRKNL